jgi:hypothetical protein
MYCLACGTISAMVWRIFKHLILHTLTIHPESTLVALLYIIQTSTKKNIYLILYIKNMMYFSRTNY